jgi:hypothetical protein
MFWLQLIRITVLHYMLLTHSVPCGASSHSYWMYSHYFSSLPPSLHPLYFLPIHPFTSQIGMCSVHVHCSTTNIPFQYMTISVQKYIHFDAYILVSTTSVHISMPFGYINLTKSDYWAAWRVTDHCVHALTQRMVKDNVTCLYRNSHCTKMDHLYHSRLCTKNVPK